MWAKKVQFGLIVKKSILLQENTGAECINYLTQRIGRPQICKIRLQIFSKQQKLAGQICYQMKGWCPQLQLYQLMAMIITFLEHLSDHWNSLFSSN